MKKETVFQRYEFKYLLTRGQQARLLSAAGDLRLLAAEALPKAKPRGIDDGQRALQTSLDRLHRLRQAVYEDYREGLLSRVTGRIMNVRRRASRRSLPIWRRPKRRPPTRRAGWNLLSRTAPSWNWTGPPWPKPWSRSLFLSTAGLRLHIPFPTTWGFYAPFESLDQIRRRPPMRWFRRRSFC